MESLRGNRLEPDAVLTGGFLSRRRSAVEELRR
jgi:hypothetical protein